MRSPVPLREVRELVERLAGLGDASGPISLNAVTRDRQYDKNRVSIEGHELGHAES